MNGIDMLMKNPNLGQSVSQHVNSGGKVSEPSLFNVLLTQTSNSNGELVSVNEGDTNAKTLSDLSLKQLEQLQKELGDVIPGNLELDLDLINSLGDQLEELMEQAEDLISQLINGAELNDVSGKLTKLLEEYVSLESIKDKLLEQEKSIQNSNSDVIQALIANLEQMLNADITPNKQVMTNTFDQLLNSGQLSEQRQNLLLLMKDQLKTDELTKADLQKLQSIVKELASEVKSNSNFEIKDTKTQAIWQDLVQTYKRRKGMESAYRENATVTGKDVSKWLTNALEVHSTGDKVSQIVPQQTAQQTQTSMPMTRLEQYVIHVNQAETGESTEQKVVNEMKRIIEMNRFIQQPNGRMQMSIALRPDNLGEMNLRIVQIDGEMMVKIAVSTNATKDLLEKNLGQLRNIFSPHQVVIEKQDLTATSASDVQQDQNEQQDDGLDEQQQNNDQDSENQNNDEQFATYFDELLQNEEG